MNYEVAITAIDHDGYEGTVTFYLPGRDLTVIPVTPPWHLRLMKAILRKPASVPLLKGLVFFVEPEATEAELNRHFNVGGSMRCGIELWWALGWSTITPGTRSIYQGKGTRLSGQVIEVTAPDHFTLNCGLHVEVEMDRDLPQVGQWVQVHGALILLDE